MLQTLLGRKKFKEEMSDEQPSAIFIKVTVKHHGLVTKLKDARMPILIIRKWELSQLNNLITRHICCCFQKFLSQSVISAKTERNAKTYLEPYQN